MDTCSGKTTLSSSLNLTHAHAIIPYGNKLGQVSRNEVSGSQKMSDIAAAASSPTPGQPSNKREQLDRVLKYLIARLQEDSFKYDFTFRHKASPEYQAHPYLVYSDEPLTTDPEKPWPSYSVLGVINGLMNVLGLPVLVAIFSDNNKLQSIRFPFDPSLDSLSPDPDGDAKVLQVVNDFLKLTSWDPVSGLSEYGCRSIEMWLTLQGVVEALTGKRVYPIEKSTFTYKAGYMTHQEFVDTVERYKASSNDLLEMIAESAKRKSE